MSGYWIVLDYGNHDRQGYRKGRLPKAYASERCKAVREAAEKMLKAGKMSAEEIAGYFSELSVEDVQEISR